jgi:hypothetical protein
MGGGHLWPGENGKTPFPQDWTPQKIIDAISDIATNPNAMGDIVGNVVRSVGTIDGVVIRTITRAGEIITGYPINLPRNQ